MHTVNTKRLHRLQEGLHGSQRAPAAAAARLSGLPVSLYVCLSVCPTVCVFVFLSICRSASLSLCLSACFFCLSRGLFPCLSVCRIFGLFIFCICWSVCLSFPLLLCLFVCLLVVCRSVWSSGLSVSLSVSQFLSLLPFWLVCPSVCLPAHLSVCIHLSVCSNQHGPLTPRHVGLVDALFTDGKTQEKKCIHSFHTHTCAPKRGRVAAFQVVVLTTQNFPPPLALAPSSILQLQCWLDMSLQHVSHSTAAGAASRY